jgi:hypothetical protein
MVPSARSPKRDSKRSSTVVQFGFFATRYGRFVYSIPTQPSSAADHSGLAKAHMVAAFITLGGLPADALECRIQAASVEAESASR